MIRLENNCRFNATNTFECGQCFRWNCDDNGVYVGISAGKVCCVKERNIICNDEDNEYWSQYFSLSTDYDAICSRLNKIDDKISSCIEFGSGIRILKQDVWETIVSFIISANNNIPRIKKIIESMCKMFGDRIEFDGKVYYSFPSAERLAEIDISELAPLKAGYRDKYIMDAAQKVASGEVDIANLDKLPDDELKKNLMKIKGVGGKVADCIMLFAFERFSVFPVDVWIKRIITEVYGVEDKLIQQYVKEKYGDIAGFAQQYLYYYYRSNS
ncbi:MAG: DNA-3-methyladenine glycosylase family protein [Monoglobaceae bacterium]